MNCSDPPERPASGTWEWNGKKEYESEASYTCGLYGLFQNSHGHQYETLTSVCGWNKSWVPEVFDPCVATSCQYIPFPPPEVGMIYVPDDQNSLSLLSESSFYNPQLPLTMNFPGPSFCEENGDILMIVGEIKSGSKKPFEVVFGTASTDEAFHMKIDLANDFIERWNIYENGIVEKMGVPFEGTTIDVNEPFMLRNVFKFLDYFKLFFKLGLYVMVMGLH